MRIRVALGVAFIGIVMSQTPAPAQDSVLAEYYGQGVHAYFAGHYGEAHHLLTTAISQGSLDPRAYLFRGLCYSMLGRPYEAKADFTQGAALEVSGADRVYPVSSSLQRIQGPLRMEIECYRLQARLMSHSRDQDASRARYEQLRSSEGEVLRDNQTRPTPAPADRIIQPPTTRDETDPFGPGAEPEMPIPAPATTPPATQPPSTAAPPTTPAPMPEVTPEADPFGTSADPFGTPPASDATIDPFADDPSGAMPAPDDDPFN